MSPTTPVFPADVVDFMPIPVSLLTAEEIPPVALYRRDATSGSYRLYRNPELAIEREDLERLERGGVKWLYAAAENYGDLQRYIRGRLNRHIHDETISLGDRFRTLNDVTRDLLFDAFLHNDTHVVVDTAHRTAAMATQLLCRDDLIASDLLSMIYHDFQTVTHSINVTYFMVVLAREMKITDDTGLRDLAAAGILHDLGKIGIDDKLLQLPDRLSPRQRDVLEKHTTLGFRRLCNHTELNLGQLMVVYQHHEREDGSGYPVKCEAHEIHDWAKICSVTNVFESLISNRPYRKRFSTSEAFELLDGPTGRGLNQEILRCWKAIMLKR